MAKVVVEDEEEEGPLVGGGADFLRQKKETRYRRNLASNRGGAVRNFQTEARAMA